MPPQAQFRHGGCQEESAGASCPRQQEGQRQSQHPASSRRSSHPVPGMFNHKQAEQSLEFSLWWWRYLAFYIYLHISYSGPGCYHVCDQFHHHLHQDGVSKAFNRKASPPCPIGAGQPWGQACLSTRVASFDDHASLGGGGGLFRSTSGLGTSFNWYYRQV